MPAPTSHGLTGWLFGSWHLVRQGHAGLVYRDGVHQRTLPPGRHRLSAREMVEPVPTATQMLTVSGQELLSADAYQPRITAVATYAVADPHRAATAQSGGYAQALMLEVQLAVRALAASRKAEDLASTPRADLDAELLASVRIAAPSLGLEIASVRIRDIVLPADLRRLLTGVDKARREGQAALERAHAEQAALRSLANAARMLRNNPELQNLRLLQTIGEGRGATIVLGSPAGLVPLREGPTEPG